MTTENHTTSSSTWTHEIGKTSQDTNKAERNAGRAPALKREPPREKGGTKTDAAAAAAARGARNRKKQLITNIAINSCLVSICKPATKEKNKIDKKFFFLIISKKK